MAEPGVARRSGSAMLLHLSVESNRSANSSGAKFVLEPAFRQAYGGPNSRPSRPTNVGSASLVANCRHALQYLGENLMKSAYELAMERLQKDAPSVPLNAEQRAQIAEIDSLYTAKIAEKELLLKSEMVQEQAKGKFDQVEQLQKQLASELRRLNEEREEKKEKVRREGN
jgi:hypothetical protein